MAARAYSTRIIQTSQVGVWVVYTVPNGKRCVVRSMNLAKEGTTAGALVVSVNGARVYYRSFQASTVIDVVDCRLTAYAGELVQVYQDVQGLTTVLNGFLFDDAGGREAYETDGIEDPSLEPPAWASA